jgi:hypothetical protein
VLERRHSAEASSAEPARQSFGSPLTT